MRRTVRHVGTGGWEHFARVEIFGIILNFIKYVKLLVLDENSNLLTGVTDNKVVIFSTRT